MLPTSIPDKNSLDADLIQASYASIKIQADEFTESFYQILFDKYPSVRPLFSSTDMKKQKNKLIESLDLVLVNVHNPKAFNSILKDLGKRHVKYGAVLTDYPLVGDALLQALEKHLGKDWTPDVKHAWSLAYQTIADTMAEGAKSEMTNDSKVTKNIQEARQNSRKKSNFNSNNKFALDRIIPIACMVIAAIFGRAIWTLTQPQPSINSSQTEKSRTN